MNIQMWLKKKTSQIGQDYLCFLCVLERGEESGKERANKNTGDDDRQREN